MTMYDRVVSWCSPCPAQQTAPCPARWRRCPTRWWPKRAAPGCRARSPPLAATGSTPSQERGRLVVCVTTHTRHMLYYTYDTVVISGIALQHPPTWNTNSPPPTLNCDWNSSANFSSMTDSVPFFSARFILRSCMLRKLTDSCRELCEVTN